MSALMAGPSPRTIRTVTVVGGNLFQLAAQYLGDATQWSRIASLNGLDDFVIVGPATLDLPPYDPSASSGGIFNGGRGRRAKASTVISRVVPVPQVVPVPPVVLVPPVIPVPPVVPVPEPAFSNNWNDSQPWNDSQVWGE